MAYFPVPVPGEWFGIETNYETGRSGVCGTWDENGGVDQDTRPGIITQSVVPRYRGMGLGHRDSVGCREAISTLRRVFLEIRGSLAVGVANHTL